MASSTLAEFEIRYDPGFDDLTENVEALTPYLLNHHRDFRLGDVALKFGRDFLLELARGLSAGL